MTAIAQVQSPMSQTIQPYRWTRAEYEKLVELGIFASEARVELLDGEILTMAAQDSLHSTGVTLAVEALRAIYGRGYVIRVQMPIAASDDSEPEPDVAVVVGSPRDFRDEHPRMPILVVEVAYSTLDYDQGRKLRRYAASGIPEYWILNLNDGRLEVYRSPQGEGYLHHAAVEREGRVAPLTHPNQSIAVQEILP